MQITRIFLPDSTCHLRENRNKMMHCGSLKSNGSKILHMRKVIEALLKILNGLEKKDISDKFFYDNTN